MLRFGKAATNHFRALMRLQSSGKLAPFMWRLLSPQARKALRQMQRKLLSKTTLRPVPELTPAQMAFHGGLTANREHFTLAAINAAKAGKVTKVSIDDL